MIDGSHMVAETFGTALRRIRTERGLSLRQLSALACVDVGQLSRLENERRTATPQVAKAVDNALDANDWLRSLAEEERASRAVADVAFDPMKRRTLMTGVLSTALAGALPGGRRATRQPRRVGTADAEHLLRSVVRIRALGHQHGGEHVWQAAENVANDGYRLLEHGTYGDDVGDLLIVAIGRAQMCAGWLAFDSGQQDIARSCYNEALSLARQTENVSIEVHALANLAFQSSYLGLPRQALRFSQAAERATDTHRSAEKMSVVPHMRQATVYALADDRRQSDKSLSEARRRLDEAADDQTEEWCSFVSHAELDGVEATAAMNLGELQRTELLLMRAIDAHGDGFARNRALYRVRLANTRLKMGDAGGAALAADAALDDLRGELTSWVVDKELRDVAQRLARHSKLSDVEPFVIRYANQANFSEA